MKTLFPIFFLLLFFSCQSQSAQDILRVESKSPNGDLKIGFSVERDGKPSYWVSFKNELVIDTSFLGFEFKGLPSLESGLEITESNESNFDQTWEQPWGEQREIRNNYTELQIKMQEKNSPNRQINVVLKIYNDGLGFRYEMPEQNGLDSVIILAENTQFKLTGDHTAWWTPADYDCYEHLYTKSSISQIDAQKNRNHQNLAATTIPNVHATSTPLTMKTEQGLHISIHEANLTNYSGMTLAVGDDKRTLSSELVPSADGSKAKLKLPFKTPWRTIQIAESAGDLITSYLILNLNEPNKLEDVAWIQPMKYMGIWWGMHLGRDTWHQGPNHGATTERAKEYIDFASEHDIKGLLVEGWNTGWEVWLDQEKKEKAFDFTTPYPDFDIREVVRYGNEKGVGLIGHHETSAAVTQYESRMDSAYAFYNELGISGVKTGYVGKIFPRGEYHHGQFMVNHYRKTVEKTAQYKIMLDIHEPIKPTGIRRTYPNMMTREGVRGQEFNAWGGGNPAEHLSVIPFTRMLAGPVDYTPGIFNIKFDEFNKDQRVMTTLAHQLALYVVIYSPLQMAADLPEHYEKQPAFQFIDDVAVDWETTKVLNGEIGEFITVARQERGSENWFLGAITNNEARTQEISLNFLAKGKTYEATIYADGKNADWEKNPTEITISKEKVSSDSKLSLKLASGGGVAVSLKVVE